MRLSLAGAILLCCASIVAGQSRPADAEACAAGRTDACTRACDAGSAVECGRLGQFHREGSFGLTKSAARAAALFERACDLGLADLCAYAAAIHAEGAADVPRNEARANALMAKALQVRTRNCDAGDVKACESLMTVIGDYKGCTHGDPNACFRTGRAYIGYTPGDPRDRSRAEYFFLKGCAFGDPGLCLSAGDLWVDENAGTPDPARAVPLYQRGCDGGEPAGCALLGRLYDKGPGIPRNAERAAALHKRACDGGFLESCGSLGSLLLRGDGVPKDERAAIALLERGCHERNFEACRDLGIALRDGTGAPANPARAREVLAQSCTVEASVGCREACEMGDARACERAAGMLDTADGATPDPPEAGRLYERALTLHDTACTGGSNDACTAASRLIDRVRPLALTDRQLALRAYTRACEAGYRSTCARAAELRRGGRQ